MIMSAAQIWFCTPCTFCNGMYASTRAGWRSIVFMSQFHKKPENHGTLPVSSLRILQLVHRVPFFPCLDGPVVSAAMSLKDFYPDWDLERGVFGSGKLPKPLGPELQAFELEKKMTSKEILVWSFFGILMVTVMASFGLYSKRHQSISTILGFFTSPAIVFE